MVPGHWALFHFNPQLMRFLKAEPDSLENVSPQGNHGL